METSLALEFGDPTAGSGGSLFFTMGIGKSCSPFSVLVRRVWNDTNGQTTDSITGISQRE